MDFLAVYNPRDEEITTTIYGNYFTWKPGQVKQVKADIAKFVNMSRKELGLQVVEDPRFIPAESERYVPGFDKTDEGKKVLEPLKEKGISNFVEHLMEVIRNNQVSLRQDLANKYPTGKSENLAAAFASQGEIEAMRLVAKYKSKSKDNLAKQVEEVNKLMEKVGPILE